MLTRLKVSGFKNLVDTEIRFGPFTCIAGYNGVGKSNLFDAIRFLGLLADHSFLDAAKKTRGGEEIANLFTSGGDGRMSFDCDLIVPVVGEDEFRQPAEASFTYLNYQVSLRLKEGPSGLTSIELDSEQLGYIAPSQAKARLAFPHSNGWRNSLIRGSNRRTSFIWIEGQENEKIVRLGQDRMRGDSTNKRGGGKPQSYLARNLPRTVLSAAQNAEETRTAVLARSEMRSWQMLQLEPSALREPDVFHAEDRLGPDGSHLPATLYRLSQHSTRPDVCAEIAIRLGQLVQDVNAVRVERNEARRILQLMVRGKDTVEFPASSLSDGTLRFIALCVLESDSTATGVICLEEPENGIHPERMDAMMRLLNEMATDPQDVVDESNPLRQVIISTHSPVVVAHVDQGSLVFADHHDVYLPNGRLGTGLVMRPILGQWRSRNSTTVPIPGGDVIRFLGSIRPDDETRDLSETTYGGVVGQLNLFWPR